MREFVLAIDGGQTSTVCLTADIDGKVVGSGLGGPASLAHLPDSEGRMRAALNESVNQALACVSPRPLEMAAAYLSLTGGVGLAEKILATIIPSRRILAESDAVAALASGTFGESGVGLIAGTGVVALAQTSDGSRIIRGGWGYLFGDEGGGYWMGMQALRAAAHAADGRGPQSPLFNLVLERLGASDIRKATSKVYAGEITRPDIADLCPLVTLMALQEDPVAVSIVEEAADHLVSLTRAICEAARFSGVDYRIVATGGVLRHCDPLWTRFKEKVREQLPDYVLLSPRFPPVVGALVLGLRLAGVKPDETILDRIETSLKQVPEHHLWKHRDVGARQGVSQERGEPC